MSLLNTPSSSWDEIVVVFASSYSDSSFVNSILIEDAVSSFGCEMVLLFRITTGILVVTMSSLGLSSISDAKFSSIGPFPS
jgi:hypothetical protein